MRALVCIDDTDNLYSRGTGKLAASIIETIEKKGWGKCSGITRHQLFVHPDIPYTSHNSAMCFITELNGLDHDHLINFVSEVLLNESAEGSDPGLCVALPDQLSNPELLIDFGRKAKRTVLNKQDAYQLASQLGIHLSEHGGTGQGIIGALAGIGLRLSGNDGRYRGKLEIEAKDNIISVGGILSQANVDMVKNLDGEVLHEDELIMLGEKVKTVLLEGKSVLLVYENDTEAPEVCWRTCNKEQLRAY